MNKEKKLNHKVIKVGELPVTWYYYEDYLINYYTVTYAEQRRDSTIEKEQKASFGAQP